MSELLNSKKTHSAFIFRLLFLPSPFVHILNISFSILLLWLLYGFVMHYGWWTGDDTAILYATVKNGILKHFYCPQTWKTLSATNLTPWINLSFGIDWHFFGLHPKGFYLHQLLSFSITIIFCYLAVTEFLPPLLTNIVLILFITSRPAISLVQSLWFRHYLEGLALTAMAFWLFVKAVKTRRLCLSILGALFYALAMTAKELYVPLVVLLVFFPLENVNYQHQTAKYKASCPRLKFLIPYIIIAIAYIGWRIYMLGLHSIMAADIPTIGHFSILMSLKRLSLGIIHAMAWSQTEAVIIAVVLIGGGMLYFQQKDFKRLLFGVLWSALITIPILPVVDFLEGNPVPISNLRILIVWVMSFYIFLGIISKRLLSLPKGLWLTGTILLFFLVLNAHILMSCHYRRQAMDIYMAHKTTGEFVLLPKSNAVLVNPPTASWFYLFLKKLAIITHQIASETSTPKICGDICLCSQIMRQQEVSWWKYDKGKIMPIDKLRTCIVKNDKPLWVKVVYQNGVVQWKLGPYQKGAYFGLTAQWNLPAQTYGLPAKGIVHIFLPHSLDFWLRYDSPEGWCTYSPLLHLNPKDGQAEIYWYRK